MSQRGKESTPTERHASVKSASDALAVIAARLKKMKESQGQSPSRGNASRTELLKAMQWISHNISTHKHLRKMQKNVALQKFVSLNNDMPVSSHSAAPNDASASNPAQSPSSSNINSNTDTNDGLRDEIEQLTNELERLENRRQKLQNNIQENRSLALLADGYNSRLSDYDSNLRFPVRQLAHYSNTLSPAGRSVLGNANVTHGVSPQENRSHLDEVDKVNQLLEYMHENQMKSQSEIAKSGQEADIDVAAVASDDSVPRFDERDLSDWLVRVGKENLSNLRDIRAAKREWKVNMDTEVGIGKYVKTLQDLSPGRKGDASFRNLMTEAIHQLRRKHAKESVTAASICNSIPAIHEEIERYRKGRLEDLKAALGEDRAMVTAAREAAAQELSGLQEAVRAGRRIVSDLVSRSKKLKELSFEKEPTSPLDLKNPDDLGSIGNKKTDYAMDRGTAVRHVQNIINEQEEIMSIISTSEAHMLETRSLGKKLLSTSNTGENVLKVCQAEMRVAAHLYRAHRAQNLSLAYPSHQVWLKGNNELVSALDSSLGAKGWMAAEKMHSMMMEAKENLWHRKLVSQIAHCHLKYAVETPEMSTAADKKSRTVILSVRDKDRKLETALGDNIESTVESVRNHIEALGELMTSTLEP